jgi:hypothetical protein
MFHAYLLKCELLKTKPTGTKLRKTKRRTRLLRCLSTRHDGISRERGNVYILNLCIGCRRLVSFTLHLFYPQQEVHTIIIWTFILHTSASLAATLTGRAFPRQHADVISLRPWGTIYASKEQKHLNGETASMLKVCWSRWPRVMRFQDRGFELRSSCFSAPHVFRDDSNKEKLNS